MKTLNDTLQTQRIQLRRQPGLRASLMLVAPCLAAVALYLWAGPAVRADNSSSVEHSTERLAKGLFFRTPLIWAGDIEPSEAESSRLWDTLTSPQKDTRSADNIEAFITDNPNSPWTPSLRSQLAKQYAENGRYTRALAHWEEAWEATKYMDGPGKQVADFALAHWTRLLLRLGRTEKVRLLFQETQGRLLDRGPLQVIFDETKEAMAAMQSHPEAVQGCGGFALAQIARTMTGTNASRNAAFRSAMPPQGYSLQALSEMADGMQLGLRPVVRQKGGGWVVPALAHLRQNHYIAIIAQTNDSYRVVDPILGRPKWMSAETLEEECSGFFLIPSAKMPVNWKAVGQQEAQQVLGKGYVSVFNNNADTPPCKTCPCPPGSPTRGGGPAGGPAGGSPCPGCGGGVIAASSSGPGGMPHWMVSEPFINLWVEDEPLGYQPATGPRISLTVFYKQRADPGFDPNVFGFGSNWNCSWLSYVEPVDTNNNEFALHVAGGGIRSFIADGSTLEFQSNCRMVTNDNPIRYEVLYQSGAKDVYGFIRTNEDGSIHDAYLSRRENEQGRATTFNYATNAPAVVRLLSVVDADGGTNILRYEITNAPSSNLISHVVDRFGRTARFAYDASGYLTQIIDVADLTNSFAYDSSTNDNYNSMTNLVTPYGTNTFRHGYTDIGGYTNRWITIAEPDSQFQLFLYQQVCYYILYTYLGTGLFPDNYFNNYLVNDPLRQNELDYTYIWHRNSFHWGRNQCARLITQNSAFFENPGVYVPYVSSAADYDIARLRHWNHITLDGGDVGSSLSMEREPSPDVTIAGQMTWYGYLGKQYPFVQGSSAFPSLVIKVMPDGSEWYEEYQTDSWGNRTNIISTYWNGAAVETRTNRFVYDTNGVDLLEVYGPDGTRESSNAYTNHQVLRITNALNEVTSYTYNTARQVTSIQEPSGLVTANIYDANGWRIQTYSYAIENGSTVYYGTNSFNYTNGLVRTHTDERGLTVTNTWDNLQRLTRVDYLATAEYPSPTAVAYTYNRLDLAQVVDRMGFAHSYVYDGLGQKVSETNALGQITTYSYCSCGSSEYVTQAVGTSFERQTHYVHDNQGRMTNTFYPDDYAVTNLYDSLGRVTNVTDNAGISTSYYYNHQGLIQAISNNVGQVAAYAYDVNDRVTNLVDANGISVGQTYDNLGRLRSRTYPTGGGQESWGYSPNIASPTWYTNQVNAITEMVYDAQGLRIKEILGKGTAAATTNQYTYTAAGDLESLIDGKNQSTTWHYSRYGLITNKCDATSAEVLRYKYDADSRLTNRWSKAKGNNYYTYDKIGNLLRVNYERGGGFTNQYDGLNQVTNRVDVLGSTSYLYHTNGLLQSEDGPWPNDTLNYGYTINRLRQSLSLKNTSGTLLWGQTNSYDAANRLTNLVSGAGAFVYQYPANAASRQVQKLTLANHAFITNTYDALARLTATTLKSSNNAALNTHQYGYNLAGQRTSVTNLNANRIDYGYDALGQLTYATGRESNNTLRSQEQLSYIYDRAGNLTQRNRNQLTTSLTVNNNNQLNTAGQSGSLTVAGRVYGSSTPISVTVNDMAANVYSDATFARTNLALPNGVTNYTARATDSSGRTSIDTVRINLPGTVSFQYDDNGNLTRDGQRIMTYDAEDQLVGLVVTDGIYNLTQSGFIYDGLRRLRVRTEASWQANAWVTNQVVRYVCDGMQVLQEQDGSNQAQVTYTRGLDLSGSFSGAGGIGGLLARSHHSGQTTNHFYYYADGNGNVATLLNASQTVMAEYQYDPFGNVLSMRGVLAEGNLYRFSSKEYHPQSGLYYYGYRFYDPNLQRWLNRDPIQERGGINMYGFAGNNPISRIDYYGLSPQDILCIFRLAQKYTDELTKSGQRVDNGNWFLWPNNNVMSWMNCLVGGQIKGCGGQADYVAGNLISDTSTFDANWTFSVYNMFPIPHQYGVATSDDPQDPVIYFDPYFNNITAVYPSVVPNSGVINVNTPSLFP